MTPAQRHTKMIALTEQNLAGMHHPINDDLSSQKGSLFRHHGEACGDGRSRHTESGASDRFRKCAHSSRANDHRSCRERQEAILHFVLDCFTRRSMTWPGGGFSPASSESWG